MPNQPPPGSAGCGAKRIWILVASPRSESSLGAFSSPIFGDLPAGTLLTVADDRQRPNLSHYWVGSSWESSDVAENQLNDVINGFHKGQGSLYDDLRLAIQSFARSDAAAGHPALSSAQQRWAAGNRHRRGRRRSRDHCQLARQFSPHPGDRRRHPGGLDCLVGRPPPPPFLACVAPPPRGDC